MEKAKTNTTKNNNAGAGSTDPKQRRRDQARAGRKRSTERQKEVARKILENQINGSPQSMGDILKSSDYSEATSKVPSKIINTQGMQNALEEVAETMIGAFRKHKYGAEELARKIEGLLNSKKIVKTYIKGDLITEIEEDNVYAIDKGLTHALKIGVGGGYQADRNQPPPSTININFFDPRIRKLTENYENELVSIISKKPDQPITKAVPIKSTNKKER